MTAALETHDLGKRYGRRWALQDCTLSLPAGRVAALVGPNGAGKTTLLHLAAGLLRSTRGHVRVFGRSPFEQAGQVLPQIGFVAQDTPLYRAMSAAEILEMGRRMNPRWSDDLARARLTTLGIPLHQPVGRLSGGQRAQVALALALGKRPDLVLLDEPLASLDPLARRDFLRMLMEGVSEAGTTVLLSSHIIGDLERICDHLVILSASRVQIAGGIPGILASHRWLIGPAQALESIASVHEVVEARSTQRQATLLVRTNGPIFDPAWEIQEVTLEDVVLAYLGQQALTGSMSAPAEVIR